MSPMHSSTYDYPGPVDNDVAEDMHEMRKAAQHFSHLLEKLLPDGPDKDHAIRCLRTTVMWASVALMRFPDGTPR